MKKILFLLITIPALLLAVSCSPAEPAAGGERTDAAEAAVSTGDASAGETAERVSTTVSDPAATADATQAPAGQYGNATFGNESFDVPKTIDEVRARTIEYFNAMAAVEWIAPETMDYRDDCPWTTQLIYEKGQTYYGMIYSPYISPGVCLNNFSSYLDDSGVYVGPTACREVIGTDCGAPRRAWAYSGALCGFGMTTKEWEYLPIKEGLQPAIVKVGNYDDSKFDKKIPTYTCIMDNNTKDVMFESYAELKAGDYIVHRYKLSSSGEIAQHIRMLSKDATVVRTANGKIAPSKSFVTFSEQTSTVFTEGGKQSTWRLDKTISFPNLYNEGYMPMRIASLQTDTVTPVEMTVSGLSKPENFASSPVLKGTVKCNYNIFTLEAVITDKSGKTVSSGKYYPYGLTALATEIELSTPVRNLPAGDYRFTLTATIGFGSKAVADFDFSK